MKNDYFSKQGFTLIEVLVSVGVFSIVMLIATSAVFTIVNANKKSHTIKSVMTNLNFALESMMREIRMGGTYRCIVGGNPLTSCPDGSEEFMFEDQNNNDVSYKLQDLPGLTGRRGIVRDVDTFITSPEVSIDSMKFYVIEGDQPRVLITISGSAGKDDSMSRFNIQTTVTQRTI